MRAAHWTVDLDKRTVTHRDGWVFRFAAAEDAPGALAGECIRQPEPLTSEHLAQAPRIAREAGDAYLSALRGRH